MYSGVSLTGKSVRITRPTLRVSLSGIYPDWPEFVRITRPYQIYLKIGLFTINIALVQHLTRVSLSGICPDNETPILGLDIWKIPDWA